jgi:hypothetical protein
VSDLFTETGLPEFSKAFTQAWDAANAAHIYALTMTEQEIWRFAPAWVDRVEMEWIDSGDGGHLSLRRMTGDNMMLNEGAEEDEQFGPMWAAVEELVGRLAETWYEADSNLFSAEPDLWYFIERQEDF